MNQLVVHTKAEIEIWTAQTEWLDSVNFELWLDRRLEKAKNSQFGTSTGDKTDADRIFDLWYSENSHDLNTDSIKERLAIENKLKDQLTKGFDLWLNSNRDRIIKEFDSWLLQCEEQKFNDFLMLLPVGFGLNVTNSGIVPNETILEKLLRPKDTSLVGILKEKAYEKKIGIAFRYSLN